jgi:ABC-2 type transport system permease protein
LIFLLAGQVAPVAILPGALQTLAKVLPFRYMVSFPVEVLTGQLAAPDVVYGFIGQVGWLSVALILSASLWRAGLRRYTAVGG